MLFIDVPSAEQNITAIFAIVIFMIPMIGTTLVLVYQMLNKVKKVSAQAADNHATLQVIKQATNGNPSAGQSQGSTPNVITSSEDDQHHV